MKMRLAITMLLLVSVAWAQKYNGPRPPKPDIPYLMHADNLEETEAVEAREEARKDDVTYWVAGGSSPARTPLAGPIFLVQAEKLNVERIQLYQFTVKNNRREVFFSKKKPKDSARALRLSIDRLDEGLYRLEVYDSLENGEYSLTPDGSNQVFCFQVY